MDNTPDVVALINNDIVKLDALQSKFLSLIENPLNNIIITDELTNYFNTPTPFESDETFDILKWWRNNVKTYPTLSRMAQDFLAIPATSVPSESAMSTAGRVIDDYRSSLSPKTVKMLMTGQSWMKARMEYGWR